MVGISKRIKNICYILHNRLIEILWTILPGILIGIIGIPSLLLINKLEEEKEQEISLSITGNQWYWTYKYEGGNRIDSYTKEEVEIGENRLLVVDNPIYIPIGRRIRLLLTSEDVIHSFSLLNLGLKLDTNPGRLSSTDFILLKEGIYYGECSELCGELHSKMAIQLIGLSSNDWLLWLISSNSISLPLFSSSLSFLSLV